MDPFAPAKPTAPAGPADAICTRCGQPMSSASARYDEAGQLVCATCDSARLGAASTQYVAQNDPSRAGNMWAGAVASIMMGLGVFCSLFLGEWFFVAAPIGLGIGAAVAWQLVRDPDRRYHTMGAGRWLAVTLCGIGILLNLVAFALGLIAVLLS